MVKFQNKIRKVGKKVSKLVPLLTIWPGTYFKNDKSLNYFILNINRLKLKYDFCIIKILRIGYHIISTKF